MNVKDSQITESISKLKKLYLAIMGNSLLKRQLYDIIATRDIWVNIEDLLGVNKAIQTNEYDLEKLYLQIISLVSFLSVLRNDVARSLKAVSESVMNRMEANKKILYRMTLGALDYNIDTLGVTASRRKILGLDFDGREIEIRALFCRPGLLGTGPFTVELDHHGDI